MRIAKLAPAVGIVPVKPIRIVMMEIFALGQPPVSKALAKATATLAVSTCLFVMNSTIAATGMPTPARTAANVMMAISVTAWRFVLRAIVKLASLPVTKAAPAMKVLRPVNATAIVPVRPISIVTIIFFAMAQNSVLMAAALTPVRHVMVIFQAAMKMTKAAHALKTVPAKPMRIVMTGNTATEKKLVAPTMCV